MANNFNSFLIRNNIPKPVVVFLDGHKSHLTLQLGKFCKDNGIILVALYPNSTHILQPLDVAVFSSLKSRWKTIVFEWRVNNNGEEINKKDVPRILDRILKEDNFKANATAGFKKTGLFPFDKNAPDYKRICEIPVPKKSVNMKALTVPDFQYFESKIPLETIDLFRRTEKRNHAWEGPTEARMLYDVWLTMKKETEQMNQRTETTAIIPDIEPSGDLFEHIDDFGSSADMRQFEISADMLHFETSAEIHEIPTLKDLHAIQIPADVHDKVTTEDIYDNYFSGDYNIESSADIQTSKENHHIESFNPVSDIHRIEIENNNYCNQSESNRQSTETDDIVPYNEPNLLTPNVSLMKRSIPIKNLNELFDGIIKYPLKKNKPVPAKKKYLPSVLTCNEVLEHQTLKENLKIEADQLKVKKKEERTKKAEEKKKLLGLKKKKGK